MEAFRIARPDTDDALDLEAFEAGLHGSIVLPGSPDYDEARQVNSRDQRPSPRADRPRGRRRRRRPDRRRWPASPA